MSCTPVMVGTSYEITRFQRTNGAVVTYTISYGCKLEFSSQDHCRDASCALSWYTSAIFPPLLFLIMNDKIYL